MAQMILLCVAPLKDVEFQLRQGRREMKVPMVSTSPEEVSFYLKLSDMGDQSPFTCRYRLSRMTAWSEDSEPVELMWSDGKPHSRAAYQGRLERQRWVVRKEQDWGPQSRISKPEQIIQLTSVSQASNRTIQ